MNPAHVEWCRYLFTHMSDGGCWGVPRSGLLFRRAGDELLLVGRMPHTADMPVTQAELAEQQNTEFAAIKEHFEAAGVPVKDLTNGEQK